MMVNKKIVTKEDARFFMDMVDTYPNRVRQFNKQKPWRRLDRDSEDFKRFINIYKATEDVLSEREQLIMQEVYGADKEENSTLKAVGEMLGISQERVRQIHRWSEFIISRELLRIHNNK
jgi:DNA-directed RNA polymerase specialized sigma subunit